MPESAIVNMLIVLALTYLAVAAAASAVIEAVARSFALRARGLRATIAEQFNDPTVQRFALSLLRAVRDGDGQVATERSIWAIIRGRESLPSGVAPADLAQAAVAQIAARRCIPIPDQKALADQIERKFAAASEEMRAKYRRWTIAAGFAISFAIAALLNLDTLTIAKRAWTASNPQAVNVEKLDTLKPLELIELLDSLRGDKCRTAPEVAVSTPPPQSGAEQPPKSGTAPPPKSASVVLPCSSLNLTTLLGWALTAFFACFGGKFWYDTLAKLLGYRAGLSSK